MVRKGSSLLAVFLLGLCLGLGVFLTFEALFHGMLPFSAIRAQCLVVALAGAALAITVAFFALALSTSLATSSLGLVLVG